MAGSIVLSEDLCVGLPRMDAVHGEFVEVYNQLASAPDDHFVAALETFVEHCEVHFAMENAWMEVTGFPGCHRAEHDRVLEVVREVMRRARQGDRLPARQLVREVPDWFSTHATGMDAALAFYLKSIGFDAERGLPPEGWKAPDAAAAPGCSSAG